MKNAYFTAGEFAKLHHVNKRTLHFYDEIGLFKPNHTGDNDYRYYSYLQSSEFEMILAFRELGMSIAEITDYFSHRTPAAFHEILTIRRKDLQEQIRHLKEIDHLLQAKEYQLSLSERTDLDTLEIISCKEEYLLLSDPISGKYDSEDFQVLFKQMNDHDPERLLNRSYGSMINTAKLSSGDFESYACFFTKLPTSQKKKGIFRKPAGTYLRSFCRGNWELLPDTYRKILQYAEKNHLTLTGYAYEEGINEMAISSMDEYVTQITIKCELNN